MCKYVTDALYFFELRLPTAAAVGIYHTTVYSLTNGLSDFLSSLIGFYFFQQCNTISSLNVVHWYNNKKAVTIPKQYSSTLVPTIYQFKQLLLW